jgi:hypothetical protein
MQKRMLCPTSVGRRIFHPADPADGSAGAEQAVINFGSASLNLRIAIDNYTRLHETMLNESYKFDRKFLVCEPYGGLGNVLAALASCFLVALASGRALLVAWEGVGFKRTWSPPYEAPLGEFLLPPTGLDWSLEMALQRLPELQKVDSRLDIHLSGSLSAPLCP